MTTPYKSPGNWRCRTGDRKGRPYAGDCLNIHGIATTEKHALRRVFLSHFLQLFQDLPEVFRQIREHQHRPAVPGMAEAELSRVEALAVLAQLRLLPAVDRISQDGVADVGHVDPDLVGTARFQAAPDMGIAPVALDDLPMGHRIPGIPGGDAHLFPVRGVPPDGRVHGARVLPEGAHHNGLIGPGHGMVLELACQPHMGPVILRHRQQSGGILVDAVDDAGPQLPVDAAQVIAHGIEQAVDQGIVLVPRRGVDHQALGLVDHQHILVLIHDVQGDLLRFNVHGLGFRDGDGQGVAHIQSVIFLAGAAVARHMAPLHQLLGGAAAHVRQAPGQERVQPLPGGIGGEDHLASSFQNFLLNSSRLTISAAQPQVMKQSATLNTGKSMKSTRIMSTT